MHLISIIAVPTHLHSTSVINHGSWAAKFRINGDDRNRPRVKQITIRLRRLHRVELSPTTDTTSGHCDNPNCR